MSEDWVARRLDAILKPLKLLWQYRASLATGIGVAKANVWSRAARRKQHKIEHDETSETDDDKIEEDLEPALAFKIMVIAATDGERQIQMRWLQGEDSVLFESFCGMLKRSMTT